MRGFKYGNKKVQVGDKKFDSKREYARFQVLQMLEKAGQIHDLKTQVEFILVPSQKKTQRRH